MPDESMKDLRAQAAVLAANKIARFFDQTAPKDVSGALQARRWADQGLGGPSLDEVLARRAARQQGADSND